MNSKELELRDPVEYFEAVQELSRDHSRETRHQVVLGGRRAWLVWSIATLFVVCLFNVQSAFAILNSQVAGELKLGVDQVGLIAAMYTWVFALSQLFSGALLDKLGCRKVMIPAIALVTAGAFLFAWAHSFEMLLLSQTVLALGACAGFVGAGYVGGVWFGMARFGFMCGLVQVAAALASAFGQVGFDMALSVFTWRELMGEFGVFGLGLLVLALMFMKNPVEPDAHGLSARAFTTSVFHSVGEVVKNRQVLMIAGFGSVVFGIMLSLGVVWAPKLVMAHGVSQSAADVASASLWLGLALGSLFIVKWSDRVKSRKQPLVIAMTLQLLSVAGLIYLPLSALTAQMLCFVLGAASSANILVFAMGGDNVPPRLVGTSASIVNSAMFIVSGVLMSLPGHLLQGTAGDLPAYQHAMLVMVLLSAVALGLALKTRECYPKSH